MCWRNFCVFSLVTKNVQSRSKIALFQMSAILKFYFQKKKIITFFRRKLSQLHKKDTILHVTITIFLKQGKTRMGSGPISVPLNHSCKSEGVKVIHKRANLATYYMLKLESRDSLLCARNIHRIYSVDRLGGVSWKWPKVTFYMSISIVAYLIFLLLAN